MSKRVQYQNDVFISYSPADLQWVSEVLLPRLQAAGLKVANHEEFVVGAPIVDNIERAVTTSRYTLLVLTKEWLNSKWQRFEDSLSSNLDVASRRRRLKPLLLEPLKLPPHIDMLTYANFTGTAQQDEAEMEQLLRGIVTKSRIFMSFKSGVELDESFEQKLYDIFESEGHRVFGVQDVTVGRNVRDEVHDLIDRSDSMVVLLSEASVKDETIAEQVEYAHWQYSRTGDRRLLPVRLKYNESIPEAIGKYLRGVGYTVWQNEEDDEIVTRKLLDAVSGVAPLGTPVADAGRVTSEDINSSAKLWPNGGVISIAFLDGPASLQWRVAKAVVEWSKYANLRFVFSDVSEAAVRISFKRQGSWSYMGMDALIIPKDEPTMNFGWLKEGSSDEEIRQTVLHESGHMLGLVHEHQIPAADIAWDKEAVYRHFTRSQYHWTKQDVEMNVFQKYNEDYFPIEKEFDPESIMTIGFPKRLFKGDFEIRSNKTLSDKDKEFVKRLYPSLRSR